MRNVLFLSAILFITATIGYSATVLHVPGEYATIQEAIDAAENGGMVVVAPGTYVENIDFKGKAVVLRSSAGPEWTVIDGGYPPDSEKKSVVTFQSGEDSGTRLIGFTITRGAGTMGFGGGIYVYQSSPFIANNVIKDNKVGDMWFGGLGAGIFLHDSHAVVRDNIIKENEAYFGGGGISVWSTSSNLPKNQFLYMKCPAGSKGTGGDGGMKNHNAVPLIENNVIVDNTTQKMGGGIHCVDSPAVILGNMITGNKAFSGGGIFCDSASPTLTGNLVSGNIASTSGGGLHCVVSDPCLVDNLIRDNQAWRGGGIAFVSSTPTLANNRVIGNQASSFGMSGVGGGIACEDSTLYMVNNTVYGNFSDALGGGLALTASFATVANSIFWGDSAPTGMEIWSGNGSGLFISFCDVQAGLESVSSSPDNTLEWGIGMISQDPLFADAGGGDFHLLGTSPCWNAGDLAMPGLPAADFEGDPRITNGAVDMGADEFHPHLYYMGEAAPNGSVAIKLIAPPRLAFIQFFLGAGVLDPPKKTLFGNWHLELPILQIASAQLVPPEGLVEFEGTLPAGVAPPYELPLQALMGGFELSNLCLMIVE